jgi:hypothetical protein
MAGHDMEEKLGDKPAPYSPGYGKNIAKLAPPDDASGNVLVSKK